MALLHESTEVTRERSRAYGAIFLILFAGQASAWSDLVGLENKHPLSKSQAGELLIDELRCSACHKSLQKAWLERTAPDLSDVGSRIMPAFLRSFLTDPSAAHPGTTMPNLLASIPDAQRDEISEALTHFLVAQSTRTFQADEPQQIEAAFGKELYHSVGCVACHAPREEKTRPLTPEEVARADDEEDQVREPADKQAAKTGVVDLGHIVNKYSRKSLSEFLFQPLQVRSSGRMPDMKLTPTESQALACYLLSEQRVGSDVLLPQEKLVALGRRYFAELNCAACHQMSGITAQPFIGSLRHANPLLGCLAETPLNAPTGSISKIPRFALKDAQIEAIRAALRAPEQVDTDQVQIAKTLTAFNCIACHIRDDFGGVAEDRNVYFETSERNLGEDGRIPPPLTLMGAKLRPAWLKKVLFDGESVRPYMTTRMPQFGEPNLRHLPALFSRVDVLEGVELNIPSPESDTKAEREREKMLRAAGRELLGQQGVYCVACHNFNGKPAPVNKGIDLMTTFERLQPGWFNNFVRNPGKYRPRIVMPYSWPDGIAVHDKILEGNTALQIEAIWYYLSLGTSAADPPGIRRVDTVLLVEDTTRTYRGRSSVAGFRGIAVGFPEKLSYAFNAETGSLSAIWQGDFIRVDRGGQGSGGFNPAAPAIQLAQDVAFVELADENQPWPLRPVMTKEAPANPNPMYPKNLGYQFKGYYMDERSVPTLMYRSGEIDIEDRTVAVQAVTKLQLIRTFEFKSLANHTLWFRVLTGDADKLRAESKLVYATDKLRITIPDLPLLMRPVPDNAQAQVAKPDAKLAQSKFAELLLRIEIPQGQSSLSLTYEPLNQQ